MQSVCASTLKALEATASVGTVGWWSAVPSGSPLLALLGAQLMLLTSLLLTLLLLLLLLLSLLHLLLRLLLKECRSGLCRW